MVYGCSKNVHQPCSSQYSYKPLKHRACSQYSYKPLKHRACSQYSYEPLKHRACSQYSYKPLKHYACSQYSYEPLKHYACSQYSYEPLKHCACSQYSQWWSPFRNNEFWFLDPFETPRHRLRWKRRKLWLFYLHNYWLMYYTYMGTGSCIAH